MLRLLAAIALTVLAVPAVIAQSFPVTIPHAFGETTIEKLPERIVTWGWGNHDALLSLGVVPVAQPFSTYGGGDNGLRPPATATSCSCSRPSSRRHATALRGPGSAGPFFIAPAPHAARTQDGLRTRKKYDKDNPL